MLSCFNLKPGIAPAAFCQALDELTRHMQQRGLLEDTGPVGRRQRHPVMDTDTERDHEYFFVMSFGDRAQCDRAVEYLAARNGAADAIHRSVYSKIDDPLFICWEDLGRAGH